MTVHGKPYRTIWVKPDDASTIQVIDQRQLPHAFEVADLRTVDETCHAIRAMVVRGAGLIGATAGYGMYLAARAAPARPADAAAALDAAATGRVGHGRPRCRSGRANCPRVRSRRRP